MAFPKPHVFDIKEQAVSRVCRVLGHPARVRILMLLQEFDHLNMHEICRMLPLHQATVSAHLRKLRLAGLIDVEVDGLYNTYFLNQKSLSDSRRRVVEYFNNVIGSNQVEGVGANDWKAEEGLGDLDRT